MTTLAQRPLDIDATQADGIEILSDAAGRIRLRVDWLRSSPGRAVAVEDHVDKIRGVRAVHAYPRTASVVIWYSRTRIDRAELFDAVNAGRSTNWALVPVRSPRSADVTSGDVLRMTIGGAALVLLGLRRYAFRRPPILGPTSRLVATGATIFTGDPFLKGAVRSRAGTGRLEPTHSSAPQP